MPARLTRDFIATTARVQYGTMLDGINELVMQVEAETAPVPGLMT